MSTSRMAVIFPQGSAWSCSLLSPLFAGRLWRTYREKLSKVIISLFHNGLKMLVIIIDVPILVSVWFCFLCDWLIIKFRWASLMVISMLINGSCVLSGFFYHLFTSSQAESSWSNTTSTVPTLKPPRNQRSRGETRLLDPGFFVLWKIKQIQKEFKVIVFCTQQLWVHFSIGRPGLWHVPGPWSCPHNPCSGPEEAGDGSTGEIWGGQEFETGHRRPAKGWPTTH